MSVSHRSTSKPMPEIENPALIVGHPGHELKVFGWMSATKPRLYVITDGSGRHGISRISSTAALLASVGSRQGEFFGRVADAEIYSAILAHDFPFFFRLLDELASSFAKHQIDCVVGDAAEGFNPTHDVCRSLINAAVLVAERTQCRKIWNFEVSLTEWEHGCPEPRHDDNCFHWSLNDLLLAEKIAAAKQYVELKAEVEQAIALRGEEYFRIECLRKTLGDDSGHLNRLSPAYEAWGERRVAEGQYQRVIRYAEHVLPLMNAIMNHAVRSALQPPVAGSHQESQSFSL